MLILMIMNMIMIMILIIILIVIIMMMMMIILIMISFIPMPMPKPLCRTATWTCSHGYPSCLSSLCCPILVRTLLPTTFDLGSSPLHPF